MSLEILIAMQSPIPYAARQYETNLILHQNRQMKLRELETGLLFSHLHDYCTQCLISFSPNSAICNSVFISSTESKGNPCKAYPREKKRGY